MAARCSEITAVNAAVKLSSPATREFWEIPVLFEDEHLLALDKPAGLLTSPDRYDPSGPSLMDCSTRASPTESRGRANAIWTYLSNAHRPDFETSGVILLAKNKPALVALANLFSSGKAAEKIRRARAGKSGGGTI